MEGWVPINAVGSSLRADPIVSSPPSLALALLVAVMLAVGCGARRRRRPPQGRAAVAGPPDAGGGAAPRRASVRGMVAPDHRLFAGIPYAAPPVGPLRWQPPAPGAGVAGDAGRHQARAAVHAGHRRVTRSSASRPSEDCLTLNVWTPPRAQHDEQRPVMVWIHGGGVRQRQRRHLRLALAGDPGRHRRRHDQLPAGCARFPGPSVARSAGRRRQLRPGRPAGRAALGPRQHRRRSAAIPDKVTIAGESAGGMSVCDHLVAPGSAGLFRAAIIQSAPCQAQADAGRRGAAPAWTTRPTAGCRDPATTAQCLRALPADKLREPAWYYFIGDRRAHRPGHRNGGAAGRPDRRIRRRAGGPRAGADRHQPRRVHACSSRCNTCGWVTAYTAERVSAAARRHRSAPTPPRCEAHYPLEHYGGDVPLAYSAAVTDGVFACAGRPNGRRPGADAAGVRLRVQRPRRAGARVRCATLPFPVGASHSLELRYLFDIGGAPPLDPGAADAVRPDDRLLEPLRHHGAPKAAGQPRLAGARR